MGTDKPPRSMRTDVRDPPLLVNAGGYAFHAAAATRPFESESEESKDDPRTAHRDRGDEIEVARLHPSGATPWTAT